MNLKNLHDALKSKTAGNPQNVEVHKDSDGENVISLDGFEIRMIGQNEFSILDTFGEIKEFNATGENALEFFKGFYDAYVEEFDSKKSNEFYDIGFNAGISAAENKYEDEDGDDEQYEEEDYEEEGDGYESNQQQ